MIKIIYFCLFFSAGTVLGLQNSGTLTRLASSQYYISTDAVSFVQAWAYCDNSGMKFVSLTDETENAKLIQTLGNIGVSDLNSFWVGGLYLESGLVSKWYWVNGDSVTYKNWYSTARVSGDNCIRWEYYPSSSLRHGKWWPANCSLMYKFICKN